jgi:hypothetical protein
MVAGPPIPTPADLRLAHILEEDGALFCRYVTDQQDRRPVLARAQEDAVRTAGG